MTTRDDYDREVYAADWHDIPRGYYALPIHLIDLDDSLDECAEESYGIVGYHVYERKVQRTTKTGRIIGRDSWRGKIVADENVNRDQLLAYANRHRNDWHRQFDILQFIEAPRFYQAMYGQWSGKCGCCGRTLTDPASKMRGIGPECAGLR